MKHLMLFETFLGPLNIKVLQGFEHDNAKYFEEAKNLAAESVSEYMEGMPNSEYHIKKDIEVNADRYLSLFALDTENNVVGVIFLNTSSIFSEIEKSRSYGLIVDETDLTEYRNKRGLHGCLFAVKKSDRKSYIAWMLMQEVMKHYKDSFDYFYGVQAEMFKSNINYEKRAKLVATIQPNGIYKKGCFYLKDFTQ